MNFDRTLFIEKFIQEAKELVQRLNEYLISLEKEPKNQEVIRNLMRTAHTLKGSSKIMRFNTVSQLAHKIEELLIGIREGRLTVSDNMVELLFSSTDIVSRCIAAIQSGQADTLDISPLCTVLDQAARGEDTSVILAQLNADEFIYRPTQAENVQPYLVREQSAPIALETGQRQDGEKEPLDVPGKSGAKPHGDNTIRINIDKLDNTIRLVSEIAVSHRKSDHTLTVLKDLHRIARKHTKHVQQSLLNGSMPFSDQSKAELLGESQQLAKGMDSLFKEYRDDLALRDILLNELYEDVLRMRMLPLSNVFETFPRAVRDMAKHFKKQIALQITGGETTLDKKIIERLTSPLIHLLRNCIDHGIETPQERLDQGKQATGTVTISAHQESGHIEIKIMDDGRGIQTDKLLQRLIKRGIFSEEKARTLGEAELLDTIFLPGVSTSDIITDISGRGFGMEIVKTDIEQLKGTVSVSSKPGQGTQCVLTLPVTLTTLRCIIVASQRQQFAVPIDAIEETLQILPHECIQVVGHKAIRLRNQIIYLISLADLLTLPKVKCPSQDHTFVLIARSEGKRVGLLVDKILDEQDIVVKQLPRHIRRAKTIAGATVSSGNTIMLILHIPEIISLIKQPTAGEEYGVQEIAPPRILIVEDSVNTGEIEKQILESQGYAVDLAQDGIEALEKMKDTPYNLIVTDIEMPGMDGFTLTEHIRSLPNCPNLPIVIVTSLERESDKKRGIQVGADAYITKGDFEQSQLVETVKSLVHVSR